MIIKFGKYKGKSVEEIAQENEGLGYLDWLRENTDPKDAKYGAQNQILLNEINKALDGKTIYKKDKKKSGGASVAVDLSVLESKLDKVIAILKANFGDAEVETTPF